MRTITFRGRQLWPLPGRPPARHGTPDPRSLLRRWEDGPGPSPSQHQARHRRDIGSMDLDAEHAWRRQELAEDLAGLSGDPQAWRARWEQGLRCDDTGEHNGTMVLPRLGPVPSFCPRCEAPDDGPHYEGCAFYDPDEAALFAVQFDGLEPITLRARNMDPDAWRPYLTAAEFAETFPGVPYERAPGPDLRELYPLNPELADQLDQLDHETEDWLSRRAAAHADLRARLIMAWQAIWQH